MRISKNDWKGFVDRLREIDDRAAEAVVDYMMRHDTSSKAGRKALIEYAYGIATKYGEGAAEMACQMYDAVAQVSGASVAAADPARTATYGEVAKTINGALMWSNTPESAGAAVGRLVKTAGVDTTIKNAIRDGAEWAWVPQGDTCMFCIMLASQGWVRASKKVLNGDHAEHIHNNCDCTFAVRFDGKSTVEGYDPDRYLQIYNGAEGSTWKEKLNSMRRADYEVRKDAINAQKRVAYARRTEFLSVLETYKRTSTPGEGKFIVPDNREYKNREKENMELLYHEFGGDIEALEEHPGQKNPDYRWRGHYWEEQEPIAYTKNAVDKNTREAIHQIMDDPGGIVLDIGNSDMEKSRVEGIILERLRRSAKFDCDVLVIRNGKVEDVYRYKRIKK